MKKILLLLFIAGAYPATADDLDVSWATCRDHRRIAPSLADQRPWDGGYEYCQDVLNRLVKRDYPNLNK